MLSQLLTTVNSNDRRLAFTGSHWLPRTFLLFAAAACVHANAQGTEASYKLHAGDKIQVSVWKEVDLQRPVTIRPDGKFSFP